ncbi:MAG: glycosyltransferase family 39 protein [Chloroflexi bacterium]|nr:glycosyltransferase family 39 protein [Chloroflexota bacterium]
MKRIDHRIVLGLILLLGLALRMVRLDLQPLWADEGYSLFFATRDFVTMLNRTAVDIHPPLYYALLQLWMAAAGKTEPAVRLFSVLVGTAAIPAIYVLGLKLSARRPIALTAAFLLAVSPLDVYYSQEVRMYGLVTLLCLVSIYLFVQLLEMQPGAPRTALVACGYIGITSAALYTQYYAAFILAAEIVCFGILAVRRSPFATRQAVLHWTAAWAAIVVLYVPWLAFAGQKLYTYVRSKVAIEQYSRLDPVTFIAQHLAAFSTGHLTDWSWLAWGSLLFVALGLVGVAAIARQARSMPARELAGARSHSLLLLLSSYLGIPLLFGYLINLIYPFHPLHNERLLLLSAPAFLILIAFGLNEVWDQHPRIGLAALALITALAAACLYDFYTVPRYPDDDYRPLIAQVQSLAQPGDVFLAPYPWQIGYLESYYTGAPLTIVETPSDSWVNQPGKLHDDLDGLMAKQPRVWLPALQTLGRVLEDKIDADLAPRTFTILDTWFGNTRLELFERAADPPIAGRPLDFDYLGRMRSVAAGQDIVRLLIKPDQRTSSNLKASFRLVDVNGNLWAQDDRDISRSEQRIGIAIPLGTPPGTFHLKLAVYRVLDGTALKPRGDPKDPEVTLAEVQVIAPAQPDLAAIPGRTLVDLGRGMRIVGIRTPPFVSPGEPAPLVLYWQAASAIGSDESVVLQIRDSSGSVHGETRSVPSLGIYPPTKWLPGQIVKDPHLISVRADTPDGSYGLFAGIAQGVTTKPISMAQVGYVTVRGRPHYYEAPAPAAALAAQFGSTAKLIGYDLSNDNRNIRLVLYWHALETSNTSYTVFVHVLDSSQVIRAQQDHVPGDGAFPTTSWVKGEYLADLYQLQIPADAAPGGYIVEIGMYDAKTGIRLPVQPGGGDSVLLPTSIAVSP